MLYISPVEIILIYWLKNRWKWLWECQFALVLSQLIEQNKTTQYNDSIQCDVRNLKSYSHHSISSYLSTDNELMMTVFKRLTTPSDFLLRYVTLIFGGLASPASLKEFINSPASLKEFINSPASFRKLIWTHYLRIQCWDVDLTGKERKKD